MVTILTIGSFSIFYFLFSSSETSFGWGWDLQDGSFVLRFLLRKDSPTLTSDTYTFVLCVVSDTVCFITFLSMLAPELPTCFVLPSSFLSFSWVLVVAAVGRSQISACCCGLTVEWCPLTCALNSCSLSLFGGQGALGDRASWWKYITRGKHLTVISQPPVQASSQLPGPP